MVSRYPKLCLVTGIAACLGTPALAQAIEATGTDANANAIVSPTDLRPYAPGTPQLGIGGTPQRPARAVLRQDEDWSWLAEVPLEERKPLDALKYIPFDAAGSTFLTFGLTSRTRVEYFDDRQFGARPGGETTLHGFVNPSVALTIRDRMRFYGALKYAGVTFERFPPSPVDQDGWDVHQAFAELSFGDAFGLASDDVLARVGRQELHYGAGRLISIRGGPNVRLDFDGAMVRARLGPTIADALYFQPSETKAGSFNNDTDHSQALWGLYSSTALQGFATDDGLLSRSHLDLYYLGQRRDESPYAFQPAPVREIRHTLGARFWTGGPPTQGLKLDLEGAFQFGDVDGLAGADGSIRAGLVAGVASYGFEDLPWTPVVELRAGIGSGDGEPDDAVLATYRPLYPSGRYFGDTTPIGPGNVAAVSPAVTVSPLKALSLTARAEVFWRVEDDDGLYGLGQRPIAGTGGTSNYAGTEFSLTGTYKLNDYVTLDAVLARFETADLLKASSPGEDVTYARFNLGFSF